jgi:hypothetical protein
MCKSSDQRQLYSGDTFTAVHVVTSIVVIEFVDSTFGCIDDLDDEHWDLCRSWLGGTGPLVYDEGCWCTSLLDNTCTKWCHWDDDRRLGRWDWGPGDN